MYGRRQAWLVVSGAVGLAWRSYAADNSRMPKRAAVNYRPMSLSLIALASILWCVGIGTARTQGIQYPNWTDLGADPDFPILHEYVDASTIQTLSNENKTFWWESSGTWESDRQNARRYKREANCRNGTLRTKDSETSWFNWETAEPGTSDSRVLVAICGDAGRRAIAATKARELLLGHQWGFNGIMLGAKPSEAQIVKALGGNAKCLDVKDDWPTLHESRACEAVEPTQSIHDVSIWTASDGTVVEIVIVYAAESEAAFTDAVYKSLGAQGWQGPDGSYKAEAGYEARIGADDLHELNRALAEKTYKPQYGHKNPRRSLQMRLIDDYRYLK